MQGRTCDHSPYVPPSADLDLGYCRNVFAHESYRPVASWIRGNRRLGMSFPSIHKLAMECNVLGDD